MIRQTIWAILLLLVASVSRAEYAPSELIVKLHAPLVRSSLDGQILTQSQLVNELVREEATATTPLAPFSGLSVALDRVIKLNFNSDVDLISLSAQLSNDPQVEWVTTNNRYFTVNSLDEGYLPNDESFDGAWWLRRISAPEAWEITRGDTNVVIGIIDTGIDHTHRDLRSNLWHNRAEIDSNGLDDDNNGFIDDIIGWDFVDAPSLPAGGDYLERDNDPMDDFGHGTYVAGCAASATDNGVCYPSAGFNCRLMALRAGNINGTLEEDDIAAAVLYGVANGASIINMSFGDVVASPLLREVVQIASNAGVILTASAGNGRSNGIHYPSGFPEVISVGATDSNDFKANFSNYGPSVDIMAPGDFINSTILGGECGEWRYPSGTSYAAPIIAGVVGLMLSVNPDLTPDEVLNVLRATADDLRTDGWDSVTVNGRVNAFRAVGSAATGAEAFAQLTTPRMDSGVRGEFAVIGQASGTAFSNYTLEYGFTENPMVWFFVSDADRRVFDDTLGVIEAPLQDTILVVRLTTFATTGQQAVAVLHLYVQNEAPSIDSIQTRSVLDADGYGQQILTWTNQFARATLLMTNSLGDSVREDFGYVSDEHVAVISQDRYPGEWMAILQVTNLLGESTRSDPFPYSSIQASILHYLFNRTDTNIPHGIIGSFVNDYDCDDLEEVWVLPVNEDGIIDTLEPYEWNGSNFTETENTYGPHIPQAYGDADGDGLMEMAARRFSETRIWEQTEPCGVLNNLVYVSPDHFPAFILGRYVMVDSASGRSDLLARIETSSGLRLALFTVSPEFVVTIRDTLPNQSTGANALGAPGSAVGDFDQDGQLDFFYGDYDGDLIWCEWTGNEVVPVTSIRLRQNDATNWLALGDIDGDGQSELVVGCRSNEGFSSESQRLLQGWDYYIFKAQTNNTLHIVDSVAILGNENVKENPASVIVSQLDNDIALEVAISAFPDLYILSFNELTLRYQAEWHYLPSMAGAMVAADFNNNGVNELVASDDTRQLRIESAIATGDAPFPPLLSGEPLDETTVHLSWTPVTGAIHYELYQAPHSEQLQFAQLFTTTEAIVIAATDELLDYAVVTYDTSFEQDVSVYSNVISLAANHAPSVNQQVTWLAPQIISIGFSEPMGNSVFVQGNWKLGDGSMPSVISEGEGRRRINLSFDKAFTTGVYQLAMRNLRDAQGTLLPANQHHLTFDIVDTGEVYCHIVTHDLRDAPIGNHVVIEYSEPMSPSVLDASHYQVFDPRLANTSYSSISVTALVADRTRVEIELNERYPAGAVGVSVRIQLVDIVSEAGSSLANTELLLGEAATNLAETYVYPNPFRGRGASGSDGIFFASLPPRATIRIFALNGTLLKKIEHEGTSGHVAWDLQTQDGGELAAGVYLFKIDANGEEKMGKFAVMR
jgi:subtilisin family serine protease